MKCVITRKLRDDVEVYSMLYEPDDLPKEWKRGQVLSDYKILSEKDRDVWDRFAPVYQHFVADIPGNKRAYQAMYDRIRKVVHDKDVLELAAGPGIISKHTATAARSMISTDFSEKMLAYARRGFVPDGLSFEQADACDLRFEDNSFDVVIIANALHVIPDPEKALSEIKRVLRPDGILIAPNFVHAEGMVNIAGKALSAAGVKFSSSWDTDEYAEFLSENGFKVKHKKLLKAWIPLMYTECVKDNIRKAVKTG